MSTARTLCPRISKQSLLLFWIIISKHCEHDQYISGNTINRVFFYKKLLIIKYGFQITQT